MGGECWFVIDAGFSITYNIIIFKGTIVSKTYPNIVRAKLFDFYVSFDNHGDSVHGGRIVSGWSKCPNYAYQTIIDPQLNSSTMGNATADFYPRTTLYADSKLVNGIFSVYLYPGTYTASATAPNYVFDDKAFFVGNTAQTVVLPAKPLKTQAPLYITDPGTKTYGDAPFTLTTTGGSGTGAVTYVLESGGNVVSLSGNTVTILNAGTAKIRAKKAGDREHHPAESALITITVNKRDLSSVSVSIGTITYNGTAQTPTPSVSDSGLINLSDYTVSYSNNKNAGTAAVTINATANGNYTGSKSANFTINKAILTVSADNKSISSGGAAPTYTHTITGYMGSDTASVLSGQPKLSCAYVQGNKDGNYPITVSGDLNAANYTVEFKSGVLSVGMPQQSPISINDPGTKIWGDQDNTFTLTATGGSGTGAGTYRVEEGTAVVSISGNTVTIKKAGTAKVVAEKAGGTTYAPVESAPITITVNKRNLSSASVIVSGEPYNGTAQTPTPSVTDSDLIDLSDYTVSYSNNTNAGTATVTINATANGNYTGTRTANFTIAKRNLADVSFDLSNTYYTYNGNLQRPAANLNDGLIKASDYTVSYSNTTADTGDYTVTVTATADGNYTGSPMTRNFTVAKANGSAISGGVSVQSIAFKSLTVTPASLQQSTGQIVEYAISTYSNATPEQLAWQSSRTFSNLSNTTYYVYARSASTNNYSAGGYVVSTIPGTGWTGVFKINVTNSAGGDFYLSLKNDTTWNDYTQNKLDFSSKNGLRTVSFTLSFAPWMLNGARLRWDTHTLRKFAFGDASLSIGNFYQSPVWTTSQEGNSKSTGASKTTSYFHFWGTK